MRTAFAHIQQIVNENQEEIGRCHNQVQGFAHIIWQRFVTPEHGANAHDSLAGCAQFVRQSIHGLFHCLYDKGLAFGRSFGVLTRTKFGDILERHDKALFQAIILRGVKGRYFGTENGCTNRHLRFGVVRREKGMGECDTVVIAQTQDIVQLLSP